MDPNDREAPSTADEPTMFDAISADYGEMDDAESETEAPTDEAGEAQEEAGEPAEGAGEQGEGAQAADEQDEQGEQTADEPDEMEPPAGLSEKANERFRALAQENKRLKEDMGSLQQWVEQAGLTPEQFSEHMSMLEDLNSGDTERLRSAKARLMRQLHLVAEASGEPVQGLDYLSDYPDLQAAVDDMQITREHAVELARARTSEKLRQDIAGEHGKRAEQRQQHEQALAQEQQRIDYGVSKVSELEAGWRKSDPDFERKRPMLQTYARDVLAQFDPMQWDGMLDRYYQSLNEVLPSLRERAPPPALRGNGASPGRKEPKTMFDALTQSLGME